MAVVTINGEIGSGGRVIGPEVARRLGADYVDRLILAEAARRIGATVEALVEKEQRPATLGDRLARFLQNLLERSAVAGTGGEPYFGPGLEVLLGRPYEELEQPITRAQEVDDARLIEVTREVITELARGGNVVITGRASNMILRDMPGVLHVRITAPLEFRLQNIMREEGVPREEAERILQVRERARIWFFRRFFKVDPANSLLYHLTINAAITPVDLAAEVIAQAARGLARGKEGA